MIHGKSEWSFTRRNTRVVYDETYSRETFYSSNYDPGSESISTCFCVSRTTSFLGCKTMVKTRLRFRDVRSSVSFLSVLTYRITARCIWSKSFEVLRDEHLPVSLFPWTIDRLTLTFKTIAIHRSTWPTRKRSPNRSRVSISVLSRERSTVRINVTQSKNCPSIHDAIRGWILSCYSKQYCVRMREYRVTRIYTYTHRHTDT